MKIDRCCCTCDRNKRKRDESGDVKCICEVDGHYIGYIENFYDSCRRYALDRAYKPGGKWYEE